MMHPKGSDGMKEVQYQRMTAFCRKTNIREKVFAGITKYLPDAMAVAYPAAIVVLLTQKYPVSKLLRFILVPLTALVLVTALRHVFHAPRPYDQMNFQPLLSHKPGDSFPSRHTASSVIIALAFWYIWPPLGIAGTVAAVIVGASRVVAGLHYPKDVLAGAAISLVIGALGFWIL